MEAWWEKSCRNCGCLSRNSVYLQGKVKEEHIEEMAVFTPQGLPFRR